MQNKNAINTSIILGLLLLVAVLLFNIYMLVTNSISLVKSHAFDYAPVIGLISAKEGTQPKISYKVNNVTYIVPINDLGFNEYIDNSFISIYYNTKAPEQISSIGSTDIIQSILFESAIIIIVVSFLSYYYYKKNQVLKNSHKVPVTLYGYDGRRLVYSVDNSKELELYYTNLIYFEKDYDELKKNNKTKATLLISNKNPNWWSWDLSEVQNEKN